MSAWSALLLYMLISAAAVGGLLVAARVLRVVARSGSALKTRPYECGEETDGPAWIRFHPRYYVVALFFVLFDVEAAFFFPWAVAQKGLGWAGLASVALFTGVLLLGWWYAVRKGALQWQ
jgi:NADH-quinone oxidoreductase subunit A